MAKNIKGLVAGAAGLALLASGLGAVPALAAGEQTGASEERGRFEVTDATFQWAVNDESSGGAYWGGANWLVAGTVGDVHGSQNRGSTVWSDEDGANYYKNTDGNVTITRPSGENQEGPQVLATWENRNFRYVDENGEVIGTLPVYTTPGSTKQEQVNIANGTGWVDPSTDSAEIQWEGSWTFVYYGGMTYWSINNPKLTLNNGEGQVTGTYSGYGADMFDLSKWVELESVEGVVADLKNVDVKEDGTIAQPEYEGVEIEVEAQGPTNPQNRNNPGWGGFPQDWVDFNVGTGQAGYWFSSGGQVDGKKPAKPITITYTAPEVVEEPPAEHGECDPAAVENGSSTCVDVNIPEKPTEDPTDDTTDPGQDDTTDPGQDEQPTGEFKWTLASNSASLGNGTANEGGNVTASGALPQITVNDTRSNSQGWELNGVATAFEHAAGSDTFGSAALGWTPQVDNSEVATPGAAVQPNEQEGLASAKLLASATGAGDVNVDATLNLNVLAENVPATSGNYRSVLTVTAVTK